MNNVLDIIHRKRTEYFRNGSRDFEPKYVIMNHYTYSQLMEDLEFANSVRFKSEKHSYEVFGLLIALTPINKKELFVEVV